MMGNNFKLTVRYPNSPWQHIKTRRNDAQPLIALSFVLLKER